MVKLAIIITSVIVAGLVCFYACSGSSNQAANQTPPPQAASTVTMQQLQQQVQELQRQLQAQQLYSHSPGQRYAQVAPLPPSPPTPPEGPTRGNWWNYIGPKMGLHYSPTSGAGIAEALGFKRTAPRIGEENGSDPAASSAYEDPSPPEYRPDPASQQAPFQFMPRCPYEREEDQSGPQVYETVHREIVPRNRPQTYSVTSRIIDSAPQNSTRLDCGRRAYPDRGHCHCYSGGWLDSWGMCQFTRAEQEAMYHDRHRNDR